MSNETPASLSQSIERARARWPGIAALPAPQLRLFEQRCKGAEAGYPDDLFLALACMAGDRIALDWLEREILPGALKVATRLRPPLDKDELGQAVRIRLLQPREKGTARIADYDGSVPLQAWARVISWHCALDLRKARSRDDLDEYAERLMRTRTPEENVSKERFRLQFRAAFLAAIKSLPSRERTVLCLHEGEGVTIDQVAKAYGVGRSTIKRWIATARATALQRTRKELAQALNATDAEIDSVLRGGGSGLAVSISALLSELDPASGV